MVKKKAAVKHLSETVRCDQCGEERLAGEPVYECVECGAEGFDCCIAGKGVRCNSCEESVEE